MYVSDQINSAPEEQFGDQSKNYEDIGENDIQENFEGQSSTKNDELINKNFADPEKPVLTEEPDDHIGKDRLLPLYAANAAEDGPISDSSEKIEETESIRSQVPEKDLGTDLGQQGKGDKKRDIISEGFKQQSKEVSKNIEDREQVTDDRINYALLNKADLLSILEEIISNRPVIEIRHDVEIIKTVYYKKHRADLEEKRKKFINEGGRPEDFKPAEDPEELRLRELMKKYRDLRLENTRFIEEEKQENLKKKYQVIEEIKELINSQESINKTFQDFRELQSRWREIGIVPQGSLNDLWETYHHYVEKFYDYININKELRDLDLRKNLEEKIALCEKAEALLLEPNILSAFNTLQVYHEEWREIGPVPIEKRAEIWERFKDATSKVNKKHQQYYQDIKEQQKKNLEQKLVLCEKVESLLDKEFNSHKSWLKVTSEVLEIQKIWKTIGFAPKKENNKIYARFRSACDSFFERKRDFYAQNMEEQNVNLQKKLDLCVQAEALSHSSNWKATTDEMIKLQKQWKQIGPIPRKQSDIVWKRFRKACDNFFVNKAEYFKRVDSTYEVNLELKENLIKEITDFVLTDDMEKNLEVIQDFQRKWTEIGFVPIDKKEEIQQKYRDALNKHFDNLEVDDLKKNVLKFESRIENIMQKPHSGQKLRYEREKYMNKLQQLKSDIAVWENNIGFFANNKKSIGMKRDFQKKIESAHQKIKLLEEKISLLDELELDD